MKLVLCIDTLGPGGAERVLSLLANRWGLHGHEVYVVTLTDPAGDFFELVPAVGRSSLGAVGPATNPVSAVLLVARRAARIRRLVRRTRPDAVICFMPRMAAAGVLGGLGTGTPVVVSERTDPRFVHENRAANTLRTWSYRRAAALVVPTASLRQWALPARPRQVVVIPNPVDPAVQPRSDVLRTPTVVGIGRLGPEKGFDLLIDAFASAAATRAEWCLRIVGDGPLRDDLRTRADATGIGERIHLDGLVPHTREVLSGASIFVLASRHEGFPNVVLEALATGTPVVATRCASGPAEIIDHDRNGLLVPTEDVPALASALKCLMDDEVLRRRLGSAGHERAASFDLEAIGGRWDALLRSLDVLDA